MSGYYFEGVSMNIKLDPTIEDAAQYFEDSNLIVINPSDPDAPSALSRLLPLIPRRRDDASVVALSASEFSRVRVACQTESRPAAQVSGAPLRHRSPQGCA